MPISTSEKTDNKADFAPPKYAAAEDGNLVEADMAADIEGDLEADMEADLVRNLSHGALAFATARARRVCIRRLRKCEGRAQSPASQTFV